MLSRNTVGRAACWLVLVNALALSATVNALGEDEVRVMPPVVAEKFVKLDRSGENNLCVEGKEYHDHESD